MQDDELDVTLCAVAFHLTLAQSKVLTVLWGNVACPAETIAPYMANVHTAIYRLRERMREHGVQIENRQGIGYVLTPESREAIRARLRKYTAQVTGVPLRALEA